MKKEQLEFILYNRYRSLTDDEDSSENFPKNLSELIGAIIGTILAFVLVFMLFIGILILLNEIF
ncbi:MAG: hypothetical protein QXU31_00680 [Archaeoglobaceae archaeon]